MKKNKIFSIFYFLYLVFSILFLIFSYFFLDTGLTLTSWKPYLEFQQTMRWFGNFHRQLSTIIFISLSVILYIIYYLISFSSKKPKSFFKKVLILSFAISGILIFSYPAFSHDIFNYIFNAKMVLIYHSNPHLHSAWEFADPMLGFMRNVHTPAPYFYGWTILSLLPFIFGFNRIFLEIISFKAFSFLSLWLSFIFLRKILTKLKPPKVNLRLTLFLLNPLILIEAIGIGHNDLAMMTPALLSLYFLVRYKKDRKIFFIFYFLFFILFSISTKYATVVLLPLFLIWFFKPDFDFGLWGAIFLFLLPFTRPLDQLHSWYLIWPLTWSFLAKKIKVVYFFCFLSFFSLLRYAPYIWFGNWDSPVPQQRFLIYFLIPGLALFYWIIRLFWIKIINND